MCELGVKWKLWMSLPEETAKRRFSHTSGRFKHRCEMKMSCMELIKGGGVGHTVIITVINNTGHILTVLCSHVSANGKPIWVLGVWLEGPAVGPV